MGDALGTLPTIDERYLYEVVEGEPGTTTSWEHSSGQLAIELPAGWRVGESDEGIGFIAAPSPHLYAELWEADGLAVTRYDDRSADDFFALFETTAASEFCTRIDGTAGLQPIDEVIDGMSATYECGDAGAAVGVIAMYNKQTGVGVVIEGQRDNVPDAESDNELLTTIARSLVWD